MHPSLNATPASLTPAPPGSSGSSSHARQQWTVAHANGSSHHAASQRIGSASGPSLGSRGALSSLLSASLSAATAASSPLAFAALVGGARGSTAGSAGVKAASTQRAHRERAAQTHSLHAAYAAVSAPATAPAATAADHDTPRAQTARGSTSRGSASARRRRMAAAGVGLPSVALYDPSASSGAAADTSLGFGGPFAVEAKMHAMDAQAEKYRARISTLERQLHVAQAAAIAATAASMTSSSSSASASASAATASIDHFPLPASSAVIDGSFPARRSLRRDDGAPTESDSSARRSLTGGLPPNPSSSNPAGASLAPALTAELIALRSENAGLHHVLLERDRTAETLHTEARALRAENQRLRTQVSLAANLTGLLERAEELEASSRRSSSHRHGSHAHQGQGGSTEEKEDVRGRNRSAAAASASATSSIASILRDGMQGGGSGAPAWLDALIALQESDASNPSLLHPASNTLPLPPPGAGADDAATHASWTSPMSSSPTRLEARAAALRFVTSSLQPSLSTRDRAVAVLLQEMMREHTWISGAFARQQGLLSQLVAYLRRKELGLEEPGESAAGRAMWMEREEAHKEEVEKQVQQRAMALAQEMLAAQGQNQTGVPNRAPVSRALSVPGSSVQRQQPQQVSGLVSGSAGALPPTWRHQGAPPVSPVTAAALSTASTGAAPPMRNAPVQVDGGGSATIALGAQWLPSDSSSSSSGAAASRPWSSHPGRHRAAEALLNHVPLFVSGAAKLGTEVPPAAIQREERFWADRKAHSKGYSDTPGGTVPGSGAPPQPRADDDDDSPPLGGALASRTRQAHGGRGVTREVDGSANVIPASVRRWSQVEQLDYVTSRPAQHALPAGGEQEEERERAQENARARARAASASRGGRGRNYTQTALGALSESRPGQDPLELEGVPRIEDPFEPRDELAHASSVAHAKREQEALSRDRADAQQTAAAATAPSTTSAPFAGRKRMPALQIPSSPAVPPSSLHSASSGLTPSLSPLPAVPASFHSAVPLPLPPAVHHAHSSGSHVPVHPSGGGPSSFELSSEFVPLSSLKSLYDLMRFCSYKLSHLSQLRHVVHALRRMVSSDRVTLWFVDAHRGHIWSTIGTAVTNEIRVRIGVGIAGGVAASGRSVTISNATFDPRFLRKVESGTDYITRAVMCVPLKTPRHGTFAVMQIMNKERVVNPGGGTGGGAGAGAGGAVLAGGGGYFTRTDELLVHVLCAHLAQNLWASEMFQCALREKLKSASVFSHAGLLLSCGDVREMLASLVARIRTLMDADYVVLFACSNDQTRLAIASAHHAAATGSASSSASGKEDQTAGASGRTGAGSAGSGGAATLRKGKRLGGAGETASGKHPGTRRGNAAGSSADGLGGGSGGSSGSGFGTGTGAAVGSWADSAGDHPRGDELLTVTESCTPSIAILIPQGYATDLRGGEGDGFQFDTIRVPLSSGGLACVSARKNQVTNVYDARLDARFDPALDEYVSDTVGGGSGAHGGGANCTRAFVSIPIAEVGAPEVTHSSSSAGGRPGTSGGSSFSSSSSVPHPSSAPGVDGVLVLGKLVPQPFQEWQIAQLDEMRTLLWMGVRRYRTDRQLNLAMHSRLTNLNRMVANLDLDNGGNGVVAPLAGSEVADTTGAEAGLDASAAPSGAAAALATATGAVGAAVAGASGGMGGRGAVIVTEEGGLSAQAFAAQQQQQFSHRFRDPDSGEILPTLAEFQRNRIMMPAAPTLGSTLADALYSHDREGSRSYIATAAAQLAAAAAAAAENGAGGGGAVAAMLPLRVEEPEMDESEMRDPAPPRHTSAHAHAHAHMAHRSHGRTGTSASMGLGGGRATRPAAAETLVLQREAPADASIDAGEEDGVDEPEDAAAPPAAAAAFAAPAPSARRAAMAASGVVAPTPKKPQHPATTVASSGSASSRTLSFGPTTHSATPPPLTPSPAPGLARGSLLAPLAEGSSASSSPRSTSPPAPVPTVTLYKPTKPSLVPTPTAAALGQFESFHSMATSGGSSSSSNSNAATGRDRDRDRNGSAESKRSAAGATAGHAPASGPQLASSLSTDGVVGSSLVSSLIAAPRTVSRIALRNLTDFPEVDATKTVTYMQT